MRCLSCNKQLSDREATRKYATSGLFIDLCDGCFKHVESEIPAIDGIGSESDEDYADFDDDYDLTTSDYPEDNVS